LSGKIEYIEIMLPGLLRFLLYSLFFYVIYRFIRYLFLPRKSGQSPSSLNKNSGVMIKDEICNTYLPKEDAVKEIHEGKEYFFCSQECRRKFLESKK